MSKLNRLPGLVLLWIWTLVCVCPFLLILLLSVRDNTGIYSNPLGIGGEFHWENFANAWVGPIGGAGMSSWIVNSTTAAVIAIAIVVFVGSSGAYFLGTMQRKTRLIARGILVCFAVMPLTVLLIPLFQVFDTLHQLSNPLALGLLYGALSLPTAMLIFDAGFEDFPAELAEAASVDGLSMTGTFWRIVLPLSLGPVVAVSMLTLIWVWGEAQIGVVLLQAQRSQTISVGLLGYQSQWTTDLGPQFAGLVISILPILVLYLINHRLISKGVALGGVNR